MEENHIGREIAKQRFSRSLSRDGLALHTGISAERLAALERGEALPDAQKKRRAGPKGAAYSKSGTPLRF